MKRILSGMLAAFAVAMFGFVAAVQPTAAATSYTGCFRLPNPQPGDPSVTNTWGTLENTGRTLIDTAVGGTLSMSVAGASNVALTALNGTADQARNAHFVFTGLLTGNIYVLWPMAPGCQMFSVNNATTGAFTLSAGVNNGSGGILGTTVAIPQGGTALLVDDGTNVVQAVDNTGIGLGTPITTTNGGTGVNMSTTPSAHGTLVTEGAFPMNVILPTGGNSGYPWISNGASADPSFQTINPGAISPQANGTMLANESGASQYPSAVAIPVLHVASFAANGSFTAPAATTAATTFLFDVIGGGGGGGGAKGGVALCAGGGAGGDGFALFSGATAGQAFTLVVGTGGLGGSNAGAADGVAGTNSTVTYNSVAVVTSTGGATTSINCSQPGAPGTFTATAGASGLTLVTSGALTASAGTYVAGGAAVSTALAGWGGSTAFGAGGVPTIAVNLSAAAAGVNGGGGAGGADSTSGGQTGGAGGTGLILVYYVL